MRLIDTHCHIDSTDFDPDRNVVLDSARQAGVESIIVPAVTRRRWPGLLEICCQHQSLYPALGLHPVYLNEHQDGDIKLLEQMLSKSEVVAIGEIGLDYFIRNLDRSRQRECLDAQLAIAREAKLPVILHCRKAYDDLLGLLVRHKPVAGIAHAFNGSIQQAYKLIELGFKLGFGGTLTYTRSTKLRNLASKLPKEALVLETDSPDMTVSQHQGQRNSPEYLPYVLSALAEVRDESVEELASVLYQNSRDAFSI